MGFTAPGANPEFTVRITTWLAADSVALPYSFACNEAYEACEIRLFRLRLLIADFH